MVLSEADIDDMLVEGAEDNNIAAIQHALDNGADIHAYEDIAFRIAVENDKKDIVLLLLDHGADIHVRDDRSLYLAAEHGYKEMTLLLLSKGAYRDTTTRDGINKFDGTRLSEWLDQLKEHTSKYFASGKPVWEQCLIPDLNVIPKHLPKLHDKVIDACMTGQFTTLIGAPLIVSADKADRQLFQEIWDKLPDHWQDQYQDTYMQFLKEGGLSPIVGQHTTSAQHESATSGILVGR